MLLIKDYVDMIRLYLSDIINDHKTQGQWKIQLTMTINFISSNHSDETRTMHIKSDNTEIIIGNKTDEIIEELSESLLLIYQEGLEGKMKGSEFMLDNVDLSCYKLNKINLNCGDHMNRYVAIFLNF